MLTESQLKAARALLECRPAVMPGTRAIKSSAEAGVWHAKVSDAMRAEKILKPNDVQEFCDAAGVAD